jgi:hypothetical protein
MGATRFDAITKAFAQRRLSRRQTPVLAGTGPAAAGLAATGQATVSAQDATPDIAAPDPERGPEMLFVQSFRSGSIDPKEGADGLYTVTLEQGLGQTVYFSDRPERIVGAVPTPRFLDGLGFPDDNPPNAALVVETAAGDTAFTVVELFNPRYDDANHTATYEAAVLANWRDSSDLGFTVAPADLAALAPEFGPAHLFIDDCPSKDIWCDSLDTSSGARRFGTIPNSEAGGFCFSASEKVCLPCEPWSWDGSANVAIAHWSRQCNQRFPDCLGNCTAVWY